jgi:dTDP-4-amino-4,6-dideoxygalactose transaminase
VGRLPAAVVAVDLYGQTADYDQLTDLCATYEIPLIEDAAEALGATYRGRAAGAFGAVSVFSFNGNKILTTSSGGMLLTSSKTLADRARSLATQAREPLPHYEHLEIGYNYRMSNLLAALGRAQLHSLDARVARRRSINAIYSAALDQLPGVTFMPTAGYGTPNYWLTCLLIEPALFGATREEVRLLLESHDIESRPTWKPLHLQAAFRGADVVGGDVAEAIFANGLCLPSGSTLGDSDLDRIIGLITECAA